MLVRDIPHFRTLMARHFCEGGTPSLVFMLCSAAAMGLAYRTTYRQTVEASSRLRI